MAAQVTDDPASRGPPDPRADLLDRRHQREGEQHGPADAEAELSSGLAISADAGRIVVGRARNEARPERTECAPQTAVACIRFGGVAYRHASSQRPLCGAAGKPDRMSKS